MNEPGDEQDGHHVQKTIVGCAYLGGANQRFSLQ